MFTFFISSGNDVLTERDMFNEMVQTADQQFAQRGDPNRPFVLRVVRWEQDVARRSENPNEEYVRQARDAHSTVVLLWKEVREGTREEIEGVLDEPETQLSVIWMEADGEVSDQELRDFLQENQRKFVYDQTGPPGSAKAHLAMLRVITAALADITNTSRAEELFYEER